VRSIISLPQLRISLDGEALAQKDLDALCEVRVQSALSVPTLCELSFLDPAGPFGNGTPPPIGGRLQVELRGFDIALFSGEVTALEYGYEPDGACRLRMRGYDLLHRLRKRQPVRAHVQVTAADLARELAADLGLDIKAEDPGPLWQRLVQYRQSDFELLVDVAGRCGLYLALREEALYLLSLEGIGEPTALKLGDTLLETRIEVNADSTCRSVTATTWDALRVERHSGRAVAARSGREVEAEAASDRVGGSGERHLANRSAGNNSHAEAIAQAELDCRAMSEVTVWGVAEGNPALLPGSRIDISGVDDRLAGVYVLTRVVHTIDPRGGFVSEFSSSPPPPPQSHAELGLVGTLGIVSSIADPESLGRVQVSLPALGDTESDWMGVVAAGAGAGKGLVTLPEVGDQVLVLAQGEDLAQGVVLGGLHGLKPPPDWGLDGGVVRRFGIFTPGGQVLQFDDGGNSIRLQDSSGNYLRLTPGKVLLHAATDLEIDAPGRAVVIRANTIDFERA
jgi:phage protein D/phage baseplate assembly protein gpV